MVDSQKGDGREEVWRWLSLLGAPGTVQEASSLESSHLLLYIEGWGASVTFSSHRLFQKAAVACHQLSECCSLSMHDAKSFMCEQGEPLREHQPPKQSRHNHT